MSKDCDIFSDTYGCIFTDCEGHQAPYPLLRLGDPMATADGGCTLKAITHSRCVPASHRLLTLHLADGTPCRSFLEMITPNTVPVALQHRGGGAGVRYFQNISEVAHITAVVSRGNTAWAVWSANFVTSDSLSGTVRQAILPRVHAVALTDDTLAWCLHDSNNAVAAVDPEMLFQPLQHARMATTSVAIPQSEGVGHIAVTGEATAAVFHARGIFGVDRRQGPDGITWHQRLPQEALLLPTNSCGVASGHLLTCCTAEGRLLVYDQRKVCSEVDTAAAVMDKTLGTHVSVRAWAHQRVVLLVASDQVGVLDTRTLTVVGALQQSSDGDVLDATLLPSCGGSEGQCVRVCTTALNGMLYHWRMSY